MLLTRRKILVVLIGLVGAAVLYSGWQTWRVAQDLRGAEGEISRLRGAIETGDVGVRNDALGKLRVAAASANDHTDGWWWSALTHVPLIGDDAGGVRALSRSLDRVAAGGIQPLVDSLDDVGQLSSGGRIDVAGLRALQAPVREAGTAFREANSEVSGLDTGGYVGVLKAKFDDYVDQVAALDRGVGAAAKATVVLPDLLGGSGPRDYLLVFQNNAEIRATGGLPGSWAQVRAEDGVLTIVRQGTAGQFARLTEPALPLEPGEEAVYSDLIGVFYQDANFTPDFPRAAELMRTRWEEAYQVPLDGVMALDPVGMSYLLAGTGPVQVGDVTLTADNAVQQLLNQPYLTLEPAQQDAFFADATRKVFEATTSELDSPVALVRGMSRAVAEGRFLLASYDPGVMAQLTSSAVTGRLASDDGNDPHVEIGLNDATASKMSYYLRYRARVRSQSCSAGVQDLQGSMSLNQSILAAEAAVLPESITGLGDYGTDKGSQTVVVRLYGPTGGSIGPISVDGAVVQADVNMLAGRPVATVLTLLSGPDDVVVNWSMKSGPGQTGQGTVGVTPSVMPGTKDSSFASSC